MSSDLISIIVPVYNAEKFILDTIKNVQSQSYKNWELLLIDDVSSDRSQELIMKCAKDDKRIKYFKQEKNSGPALARNRGIDFASGNYICFIDADDLWDKDKLEKQILFMKKNKCAFSYHSYEFADENCIPSGKKVIAKDILKYKQALKNNIISTITVMFDISIINKELIKMPNLKYVEDTATWWKIMRNGFNAYGIPNVYAYYRRTHNTNSSNKFKTQKYLWNLYRKEEKLSVVYSLYCIFWKNIHAILRRI